MLGALLIGAPHANAQPASGPAEVVSFGPQGEVRRIQQVAIGFGDDMVRLGDAGAPAPISVHCPSGTTGAPAGRWVDARRFVFEWARDLSIGTRCEAMLRTDLKTLAGQPVVAAGPWAFSTGGPKIAEVLPYAGHASIREQETFLLLHHCDEMQGYLFSKPVSAKEFEVLLGKGQVK